MGLRRHGIDHERFEIRNTFEGSLSLGERQ